MLVAHGDLSIPASSEALQCHHLTNHWVLSSSIGGTIKVYDSLQPVIPFILKQQLVSVYRSYCVGVNGLLKVTAACPQKQMGANDCGLFTIANMVSLCNGEDLGRIRFLQHRMRDHLIKCFDDGRMCSFPQRKLDAEYIEAEQGTTISKYCNCLRYKPGIAMIQCSSCNNFYHDNCINISGKDVISIITDDKYVCKKCNINIK